MGAGFSKDHNNKGKYLKYCLRKFDPNELEVLHKIYKELSSRSLTSGIDKETFLQYFNLPGLWGEQLFRKFDNNFSGAVELDEFLVGIAVSCRGTRSERIFVLFKLFDLNNDNLIHKFELLAMLSNFPRLTKYLFTSIDNSDSRFNTRNRNFKMLDQLYKHNNFMFNAIPLMYGNDKQFYPHEKPPNNFPDVKRSSSIESIESRESSITVSDVNKKDLNGSHSLSSEKISKSLSDFSHDSRSLSIYLAKYCAEMAKDPDSGEHLIGIPQDISLKAEDFPKRSISYSKDAGHLFSRDMYSNKYRINLKHVFSDSSFSTDSKDYFNTFSISESSRGSFSDMDFNDINHIVEHEDPSSVLVNSIIQEYEQQEVIDKSNIDLEILVDQIFEECEFNESGALDFMKFKAWLEKNDSILTMFSECLHEEVWGLKGNAFHHEQVSSTDSLLENNYEYSITNSSNDVSTAPDKVNTSYDLDDITVRTIYHVFLVKGKHPFAYTLENNLNSLVSQELIDHIKNINTDMVKPVLTENGAKLNNTNNSIENTDKILYEIFSCPNCKTPFLMCPVCYKKHNALSLHIETNNIYIKCSECCSSNDNEIGVFKSCWICCWSFNEIFKSDSFTNKTSFIDRIVSEASEHVLLGSDSSESNLKSASIGESSNSRSRSIADGHLKKINFNVTTKAGVMYKIGKTLHQWKSRYYVLIGNILYYYKDKSSTRPRGCIFLEGCYLDTLRKKQIGNKHGFSVCHKGNKYSRRDFYVDSMKEFLDWIEVLTHAMKQQTLSSSYDICEQLGQGKFSIVYRAICKHTGEEYAVKIIDKTKISHQERELLRSEISILKLLKHNNVIYLKEIIDMKDSLYIIMELVRGGELYDLIHSEHRLSEEHTHRIISQLLHTVAYLHKCGIIHRDLKPENLLLTDKSENASIKLTDFGLSTLCGPNDILTQPCGTLAYVAPEVLTMQGYNQKSDVWSIGVIMFLLIRGRLPFAIKKSHTIHIWDHYKVNFEGSIWRSISSSAKDLIKKLLEIDPIRRISVFEALDHIWVKNFVAVNHDSPSMVHFKNGVESDEFYQSIRNTTDTTFVLPYSESCNRNLNKLHYVEYHNNSVVENFKHSQLNLKKRESKTVVLPPLKE